MPTSAPVQLPPSSTTTNSFNHSRPDDLIQRLASTSSSTELKLKSLRELKNQIIGNRTKKLLFLKLDAVPVVTSVLSSIISPPPPNGGPTAIDLNNADGDFNEEELKISIVIQSATVLGSFACGLDAGVKAVLDAGAFHHLFQLVSSPHEKVVDAGARSLKLIYQSKLAPKYDFLHERNMEYLLSLLNSENENVIGLGASLITHSCETNTEQQALSDAGIIKRLITLLGGSMIQRDASLESLASIIKGNPEVISKYVGPENGRALSIIMDLTKDKFPRTRLLACICLIVIRNSSSYLQDLGTKTKLLRIPLELLDDPSQVGDEAPFALCSLVAEQEDLQKLAFEENIVDKLCNHLQRGSLQARRVQGIFLALADLCSRLECCRSRLLSIKASHLLTDALMHDSAEVRVAACTCLKTVSRSVKNLSAGYFMDEPIIVPLVQLLCDTSTSVQVAALGAISNIAVDFEANKLKFVQCGGLKQLVHLSKSMDSSVRLHAVWALKNLTFLVSNKCKEEILMELTAAMLTSLICDPEASVQEQALGLVRNLVDGPIDSVEYAFAGDGLLLQAVGRQLQSASKPEVLIQGMYVLSNVASGNEHHKEAVMQQLFPQAVNDVQSIMVKFLQSNDSRLRTATTWVIVNLTLPSSSGTLGRVMKLRNAGIVSQLKNMVNDRCVDVKLRAKTALAQLMAVGDSST